MSAKSSEPKQFSPEKFSIAKLVFYALGAGTLTLAVMIPIIVALARPYPIAALCVAIMAIVLMVAVIALVSRKMTAGIQHEIDRRRAELATEHSRADASVNRREEKQN
ncbi:hypothetical protein [Gordonia sp. (in: high G+C Gram-positive bacteria)]|uniref:hypothetical protein n=1 Tax=Gordonia sp. (in: high G+C Gram-positive bacteria) TaxID=84139 RepID=UPI003C789FA5